MYEGRCHACHGGSISKRGSKGGSRGVLTYGGGRVTGGAGAHPEGPCCSPPGRGPGLNVRTRVAGPYEDGPGRSGDGRLVHLVPGPVAGRRVDAVRTAIVRVRVEAGPRHVLAGEL